MLKEYRGGLKAKYHQRPALAIDDISWGYCVLLTVSYLQGLGGGKILRQYARHFPIG